MKSEAVLNTWPVKRASSLIFPREEKEASFLNRSLYSALLLFVILLRFTWESREIEELFHRCAAFLS